MNTTSHVIEPEICEILQRATIEGRRLVLLEQLDRKTYLRVAKVIELIGGKWSRKERAHLFDEDPAEVIADAVMTGVVVDLRKTYQEFPTPESLAIELVEGANVRAGDVVLEPSAGTGRIAEVLHRAGARVLMCEIQERHHEILGQFGNVIGTDFLTAEILSVDRIVANPPFARGQDVAHVSRMAQWLRLKGGNLVSVMSPAWTFRETTLHAYFRSWAKSIGARWTELPAGTFASSGTNVRAGIFEAQIPKR
jgi:methylase of polypeptide subunit release factors